MVYTDLREMLRHPNLLQVYDSDRSVGESIPACCAIMARRY